MAQGGKREGCGRKPMAEDDKRVRLTIRIAPETKEALPLLKARGISIGKEIDKLVMEFCR